MRNEEFVAGVLYYIVYSYPHSSRGNDNFLFLCTVTGTGTGIAAKFTDHRIRRHTTNANLYDPESDPNGVNKAKRQEFIATPEELTIFDSVYALERKNLVFEPYFEIL